MNAHVLSLVIMVYAASVLIIGVVQELDEIKLPEILNDRFWMLGGPALFHFLIALPCFLVSLAIDGKWLLVAELLLIARVWWLYIPLFYDELRPMIWPYEVLQGPQISE